jgi:arabinofuranan 3-O-arabinosyltransferase
LIRDDESADSPVAVSDLLIPGLEGSTYHAEPGAPTGSVCGFGPQVDVDGVPVLTRVRGSVGDLVSGAPLRLEPCGKGVEGVHLGTGRHRITVRDAGGFAVRDLALRPRGGTTTASASGSMRVDRWGTARRDVTVDTDQAALLAVTQSVNPGWVATLHGKRLRSVEVDGWMQGWRVPAGSRGVVELRFSPQVPYLVGLFGGLGVAALIMCVAGVSLLRRATGPVLAEHDDRPLSGLAGAVLFGALVVLSLPAAAGALVGAASSRLRRGNEVPAGMVVVCAIAAVVLAVTRIDTTPVAPAAADVLMAVAFGIMAGRIVSHERKGAGPDDV